MLRLLEHLATVEADGKEPLSQTVLREAVYLPAGATLVIVTPLLDDPLVQSVIQLAYRKMKVELFWIASPEERPKTDGRWLGTLTSLGVKTVRISDDNFDEALRGGISDGIPTA